MLRGLCLALVGCLLAGCTDEVSSLALRVRIPHPRNAVRLCTSDALADGGDKLPLETTITHLRFTVLAPPQGMMPGHFVCDRAFSVSAGNQQELLIPSSPPLVDLILEAYSGPAAGPFVLEYYGEARGVPNRASGPQVNLFLLPPEDFGCTPGVTQVARAFHSATLLSDGSVLLAGGLTQPDQMHINFTATNKFEIYDPVTHTFADVTDNRPSARQTARAFHQAVYLGTQADGKYLVMLIGGVSAASPTTPVIELRGTQQPLPPLRLAPIPGMSQPAGVEVLAYDRSNRSIAPAATDAMAGGFRARMFAAVPDNPGAADSARLPNVLMAGGASNFDGTNFAGVPFLQQADATGALLAQTGQLAIDRFGATMTPLSGSTALVFGGDLKSAGMEAQQAIEIVSGIPASPGAVVPPVPAVLPAPTAFHTASLLPDGKVLVTGGFAVASGVAVNVSSTQPLQRVTVNGTTVTIEPVPAAMFTPVGYHQATRMDEVSALLVSGGSPEGAGDGCAATCACATEQCSLANAYLVDFGTLFARPIRPMKVARYGHRQVQLLDGTALVTGGLRRAPDVDDQLGGTIVLRSAELFNPHPAGYDRANLLFMANRAPGAEADHRNPNFGQCLFRSEYNKLHP